MDTDPGALGSRGAAAGGRASGQIASGHRLLELGLRGLVRQQGQPDH